MNGYALLLGFGTVMVIVSGLVIAHSANAYVLSKDFNHHNNLSI